MRLLGILIGLVLSGSSIHARAQQPSSASYVLAAHAFTSGIPGATNQPSSANYRLAAANLGDLSRPPITSAAYIHYPGFLVPWDADNGRPTLNRFVFSNGRLWLFWEAVDNAASYTVEHATGAPQFSPLASGVTTNHYDVEAPVATSRLYRIQAITGD